MAWFMACELNFEHVVGRDTADMYITGGRLGKQ